MGGQKSRSWTPKQMVLTRSLNRGLLAILIQNLNPMSPRDLRASTEHTQQWYLADFTPAAQALHAIRPVELHQVKQSVL